MKGLLAIALIITGLLIIFFTNQSRGRERISNNESNKNFLKEWASEYDVIADKEFYSYDYKSALFIDSKDMTLSFLKIDKYFRIYNISDLIEFEVIVDDTSISKVSKRQLLSGAAIGGALFGGVGAVIGGLSANKTVTKKPNKIDMFFVLDDVENPNIQLNLFDIDVSGTAMYDYEDPISKAENISKDLLGVLKVLAHRSTPQIRSH